MECIVVKASDLMQIEGITNAFADIDDDAAASFLPDDLIKSPKIR